MKNIKAQKVITEGNGNANDYFYNGNGAEYFLMASLSRRKYDAFKLPVDYGFDVMALDPMSAAADQNDSVTPYYFQVKSVYVKEASPARLETKNGTRLVVTVPVKIKTDTLDLMEGNPNKAIVICVYDEARIHSSMELEDCPSFWFWINGKTIQNYKDILVPEKRRKEYRILYANIVYPEDPKQSLDPKNSQSTYVALGKDFLILKDDKNMINSEGKDKSWRMYSTMKDENGKHFRISGFFEETTNEA